MNPLDVIIALNQASNQALDQAELHIKHAKKAVKRVGGTK